MTVKTTPWDSTEYLETNEDIQAYLDACFEEAAEDPAFLLHALGTVAHAKNMSQLARDTGLTSEGLYQALSNDGNPSFATVVKVTKALGFKLTVEQST